jgi:hypothetical protein
MSPSEQYRTLAAELRAKARKEESADLRVEWNHLAQCYLRFAEQADRNQRNDVTYEPILRRDRDDGDMSTGGAPPL